MPEDDTVVKLRQIERIYYKPDGSVLVRALHGVDLDIPRGQSIAVMGSSGSGKSTLMNILGCLDRPTGGTYLLDGNNVALLDDQMLSKIRGEEIGFVFQSFNLIPQLNIAENVEIPLYYQGIHPSVRSKRAAEILDRVGLGDRVEHRPNELSGGQQQRAAIARALVTHPSILLADEPTGNLDSNNATKLIDLFKKLNKDFGLTFVISTHDTKVFDIGHQKMELSDGKLLNL